MAAGFLNALASIPQGFMQGQQYAIDQNYQQALRDLAIQQQRQQLAQNLQNQQALGLFYRAYGQGQPQQQPQQNPNPFGQPMDLQAAQQFTPPPQLPQQPPPQLPQLSTRPVAPPTLPPRIAQRILGIEGNQDTAVGAAGELGPGQIKPSTGAQYGYSPSDLLGNSGRQASARIAGDLYRQSGGDAAATLVGYNAGPGAMRRFQAAGDNPASVKLSPAYAAAVRKELSPQQHQQATQVAVQTATALPPQLAGQLEPQQLKQMIENAAEPGTPDAVKGAALVQLQHLMKPDAAQQLQLYEFASRQAEHREDISERRQDRAASREQTRELAEERMDIQRQQVGLGERRVEIAEKKQAEANQPPDPGRVAFWADIMKKGMPMPAGLSRTAVGSKFVQSVMNKMADEGIATSQNAAGDYIANVATVKADQSSLNNLTRQADAATSFERTANANLDTALKLSQGAVPTDLGPWVNKWIETGSTQFGGTEVPPYTAAVLTAANEYAKIMNGSTGSQGSTVDSRREAAEMLSPYLSQGQIEAVAGVLKKDMANRRNSMYGQIEDVKKSLRTGQQRFPTGEEASSPAAQSGPPEVTQEQYGQLPPNAPYRVPGNPTIFYKQ